MLSQLSVIAAVPVTAAVFAAGMRLMIVFVMLAMHIWVEFKISGKKSFRCLIGITADTAIDFNVCFMQSCLCTAANTAADQHICFDSRKHIYKCSVTGTVRVDYFAFYNFVIFHIIYLKLLRMTKVLKNRSIFISDCNSHNIFSFIHFKFGLILPFYTRFFIAEAGVPVTKSEIATLNDKRTS